MKRFSILSIWLFLLVAVSIWLAIIFVRITHEIKNYSDIITDNRPWHLSQFQIEMERLNSALLNYKYTPSQEAREKAILRMELMWNRADVLVGGLAGQDLKRYDPTSYQFLKNIQKYLFENENKLYRMTQNTAIQLHRVNQKWAAQYQLRMGEVFQRSYSNFHDIANEVQDTYRVTRNLIIALGLIIFILSYILYQEFKRSNRLRISAERASKTKSQFLANMSHEIRTPLNGIIGSIQLMRVTPDHNDQKALLDTLEQSSEALLAQINDVLDYSRMESEKHVIEHVPFDLIGLVKAVISIYSAQATNKGLQLILEDHELKPFLRSNHQLITLGDPSKLRQILLNLISNAIKFTEQGQITLKLYVVEQELTIEVEDTGVGIANENIDAIFQPFGQEDSSISRRFGGSGLGLTISKKLTEALNGDLTVTSEAGKGSTFVIHLPFYPVEEDVLLAESKVLNNEEQQDFLLKGNVLVAEDNLVNQKIAKAMLTKLGLNVMLANNGCEAVTAVIENDFDLILMDLQMPEKDGIQATKEIRTGGYTAPIIALTANSTIESQQACFDAGMNGFISKPFKLESLHSALKLHFDTL
ncbi:ATP-binding protein [Litoribacillus peritrichatus]|uniref:histidine kinase n=1 Tax=Litoribacillus peritrichatus TaxID=718191 RepID=A0ABP7NF99_9GAMM